MEHSNASLCSLLLLFVSIPYAYLAMRMTITLWERIDIGGGTPLPYLRLSCKGTLRTQCDAPRAFGRQGSGIVGLFVLKGSIIR